MEVHSLLDLLEEHVSLCKDQWDPVQRKHDQLFHTKERTVESLRRKFSDMHRTRTPTGDPDIPAVVKRAKMVRDEIKARADVGGDTDVEDAVEESFHTPLLDSSEMNGRKEKDDGDKSQSSEGGDPHIQGNEDLQQNSHLDNRAAQVRAVLESGAMKPRMCLLRNLRDCDQHRLNFQRLFILQILD